MQWPSECILIRNFEWVEPLMKRREGGDRKKVGETERSSGREVDRGMTDKKEEGNIFPGVGVKGGQT